MSDLLAFEADRRAVNITINRYANIEVLTSFLEIVAYVVLAFFSWPHAILHMLAVLELSLLEMIAGSCILALVCCKLFGHPDLLVVSIF